MTNEVRPLDVILECDSANRRQTNWDDTKEYAEETPAQHFFGGAIAMLFRRLYYCDYVALNQSRSPFPQMVKKRFASDNAGEIRTRNAHGRSACRQPDLEPWRRALVFPSLVLCGI